VIPEKYNLLTLEWLKAVRAGGLEALLSMGKRGRPEGRRKDVPGAMMFFQRTCRLCPLLLLVACGTLAATAQSIPVPRFGPRSLDRDADPSGGASVIVPPPKPQVTRTTTYITLTPTREWTSADGKTLMGNLIAFEDMVVESTAGQQAPAPLVPPANPTVIKDGKIRLLVNKKAFVLAMEKLSAADQEVVLQRHEAFKRSAP
jgi:hypothetical protein